MRENVRTTTPEQVPTVISFPTKSDALHNSRVSTKVRSLETEKQKQRKRKPLPVVTVNIGNDVDEGKITKRIAIRSFMEVVPPSSYEPPKVPQRTPLVGNSYLRTHKKQRVLLMY